MTFLSWNAWANCTWKISPKYNSSLVFHFMDKYITENIASWRNERDQPKGFQKHYEMHKYSPDAKSWSFIFLNDKSFICCIFCIFIYGDSLTKGADLKWCWKSQLIHLYIGHPSNFLWIVKLEGLIPTIRFYQSFHNYLPAVCTTVQTTDLAQPKQQIVECPVISIWRLDKCGFLCWNFIVNK